MVGLPDIDETIRRLKAYAEAGADCLYAPRITSAEHVSAIVDAVSPKPVNVLANAPFITVSQAASLGVRRVSVGGTLARTAWAGFLQAARDSSPRQRNSTTLGRSLNVSQINTTTVTANLTKDPEFRQVTECRKRKSPLAPIPHAKGH